ncbi:MAG: hypothetical protein R2792_02135 [Saprospiraceae bacterium]
MRFLLLLLLPVSLFSQEKILVADQTFKVSGTHEYLYALAGGDKIDFHVSLLGGRELKVVELVRFPDEPIYRTYELDTILDVSIKIPTTGVYMLRFQEKGMGKKVCRFTLHRGPESSVTERMDTRVSWDIATYPLWEVKYRDIPMGIRTEVVSMSGSVSVSGSKLWTGDIKNTYQFDLPPHTVRWAYRISVGQEAHKARQRDAEILSRELKKGAAKVMKVQPQTALAALALGMAIDLTKSTAGEDVEYALLNAPNKALFNKGEPYKAPIWQEGVSVDVQKRYAPLEGTWYFAFKNNNWVDDIDVHIDIEAVTEVPVVGQEMFLVPRRP